MFNLTLGEEAQIKFTVSVAGTSAQPAEVRGLLGNQLKLCAIATLVGDKEYMISFPILKDFFGIGATQFIIEVHLNGRVFTPIKRDVMIGYNTDIQVTLPNVSVSAPAPVAISAPVAEEVKIPEVKIPEVKIPEVKIPEVKTEQVVEKLLPKVVLQAPKEKVVAPIIIAPVVEAEKIDAKQFIGSIFRTEADMQNLLEKVKDDIDISVNEMKVIQTKVPFKLTKQKVVLL